VLEFLLKSRYCIDVDKVTGIQQKGIDVLKAVSEIDKMFRNRAMAATLLIGMTHGREKECVEMFCNNFEEFITDIDLEKEYITNFCN
jgi:Zn-finger domain-containing protein